MSARPPPQDLHLQVERKLPEKLIQQDSNSMLHPSSCCCLAISFACIAFHYNICRRGLQLRHRCHCCQQQRRQSGRFSGCNIRLDGNQRQRRCSTAGSQRSAATDGACDGHCARSRHQLCAARRLAFYFQVGVPSERLQTRSVRVSQQPCSTAVIHLRWRGVYETCAHTRMSPTV